MDDTPIDLTKIDADLEEVRAHLAAYVAAPRNSWAAQALAAADLLRAEVTRLTEQLDDDPRHVIEIREAGWTIRHPLACRPRLFDCPVNRATELDLVVFPGEPGLFECGTHDGQHLVIGDRLA